MREYTAQLPRARAAPEILRLLHAPTSSSAILREELRRNIVFSQHNLVSDGSFNEFHLILCRNVMIYFDERLRTASSSCSTTAWCASASWCSGSASRCAAARSTSATSRSPRSCGSTGGGSEWRSSWSSIGASLGGLVGVALHPAPATARRSAAAVAVVQHRRSDGNSFLEQILAEDSALPICQPRRSADSWCRAGSTWRPRTTICWCEPGALDAVDRPAGAARAAVDRRAVRIGGRGLRARTSSAYCSPPRPTTVPRASRHRPRAAASPSSRTRRRRRARSPCSRRWLARGCSTSCRWPRWPR